VPSLDNVSGDEAELWITAPVPTVVRTVRTHLPAGQYKIANCQTGNTAVIEDGLWTTNNPIVPVHIAPPESNITHTSSASPSAMIGIERLGQHRWVAKQFQFWRRRQNLSNPATLIIAQGMAANRQKPARCRKRRDVVARRLVGFR
jgi:hypothetical protein